MSWHFVAIIKGLGTGGSYTILLWWAWGETGGSYTILLWWTWGQVAVILYYCGGPGDRWQLDYTIVMGLGQVAVILYYCDGPATGGSYTILLWWASNRGQLCYTILLWWAWRQVAVILCYCDGPGDRWQLY